MELPLSTIAVPNPRRPRTVTALRTNTALRLAEKRQYRELLQVVQLRADLAKQRDDYGMTPLHWICTDRDVPLRIMQQIVLAYPEATTHRNLAGLLPLHVAVCKDLHLDLLKSVLKFYPKAILAETPDGKTVNELAQQHMTSRSAKIFLQMLAQEVQAFARAPPSKSLATSQSRSVTTHSTVSNRSDLSDHSNASPPLDHNHKHESASFTSNVLLRAPEWKLEDHCQLCHVKFGYFKNRHHCRNCGESVCSRHSKHFIPLTHMGLFHPQRVCTTCHGQLQAHYSYRAVALSPRRRAATQLSPRHNPIPLFDVHGHVTYEDTLPSEWAYSPRPTRSRSAVDLPSDQKGSPMALHSPNQSEGEIHYSPQPSPLRPPRPQYPPPPPPQCDRTTARSNVSSTSTLDSNSSKTTVSSIAMPPSFIKTPSVVSMYLTRMQRADDNKTVSQRLQEQEQSRDAPVTSDSSSRQWGDTETSSSSTASANTTTNQSSNDDHTVEMERQMHKLTIAKQQINAALVKSRLIGERAQRDKAHYDALAKVYEDRGFTDNEMSYTQCHDEKDTEEDVEESDNQREHESDLDTALEVEELTPPAANALFSDSHIEDSLDYAATYYDLAVALIAKQEFTMAAIELRKSLELEPKNALAWYHLAKALDGKGELLEAEAAIHTALEIQPNSLPSLSLLGKLLNARGEHDEAIAVFRKALSLQPQQQTGGNE